MRLRVIKLLFVSFFAAVQLVACEEAASQTKLDTTVVSSKDSDGYYFFNEVTGAIQFEDPGNAPYEDEAGNRYWLSASGERLSEEPDRLQYAWIESWSADLKRPFFFNQANKASQWDRPADLAWRRLRRPRDDDPSAP